MQSSSPLKGGDCILSIDEIVNNVLSVSDVEYMALGDLLDYEQPTKYLVKDTNYSNKYSTPVLTAGKSFILGYTNETTGIFHASPNDPVIIFDDFTTSFKWVDFDFKVKSSAMKMLRTKDHDAVLLKYIYYAMTMIDYVPQDHARQWIETYSQFEIPLCNSEVWGDVVYILDMLSSLTDKLHDESELRKKQLDYYRDAIISSYCSDDDECSIKDAANLKTGQRVTKTQISVSGTYPVMSGGVTPMGYYSDYNQDENTVTVVRYGTAGFVNWIDQKFWANDVCYILSPKQGVLPRYLFHEVKSKEKELISLKTDAIPAHLEREKLLDVTIRIPSVPIQQEIIEKIDSLYKLIDCIDRELSLRNKQLQYYKKLIYSFAGGSI